MALIAQAAIQNSTFKRIAGTRVFAIPPTEMTEEERWVANTHQMINPSQLPEYGYEDCYAGKTGFTNEARYTLVSFAKRGDLDIVCVVMHAPMQVDQYEDSITLLDYAFENFSVHSISKLNNAPSYGNFSLFTRFSPLFDLKNAPLSIDTDSYVVLPNGVSYSNVKQSIAYHNLDSIQKGSNVVGQISYEYGDKKVGYTDILYESIEDFAALNQEQTDSVDNAIPAEAEVEPPKPEPEKEKTVSGQTHTSTSHTSQLRLWIIVMIIFFLVLLAVLYIVFVEIPYRKRRRAYQQHRRRRQRDSYLNL